MALPPGPPTPEVLQTVEWMARPTAFLRRCQERYGDVFTVRTAPSREPMVLTSDPDLVRRLFTEYADVARGGSSSTATLEPFVGPRSILLIDGPEHLRRRRLILPPLHGERMRAQAPLVAELAARELASWPRGEPVATLPRMRALTLEVITRLVFGARDREEVEPLRAAIERTLRITSSLPRLIGLAYGMRRPWEMFDRAMVVLNAEVARAIARRRADPQEGSVLDMLLAARDEDGEPLPDGELRDHLVTLLAAGHETTASGLAWAFERLSRHPEVLERIRRGDDAYLDATVREVLRIRPVLVLAPRRLAAPLRFGGHDLPAGTNVAACSYLVHRRADLYPDPHAFRPERWLEGRETAPYAWIPFGGGGRRCPGAAFASMEMAEVLRVAARYELVPGQAHPERARRRSVAVMPAAGGQVRLVA
jgi:cytochrome P450 family 135